VKCQYREDWARHELTCPNEATRTVTVTTGFLSATINVCEAHANSQPFEVKDDTARPKTPPSESTGSKS